MVNELNEELVDLGAEIEELLRINEDYEKAKNEWKSAWDKLNYDFCVSSCEVIKTSGA
jgi:hypothetical protein